MGDHDGNSCKPEVARRLLAELQLCLAHLDEAGLDIPALHVDHARALVEKLAYGSLQDSPELH